MKKYIKLYYMEDYKMIKETYLGVDVCCIDESSILDEVNNIIKKECLPLLLQ